MRSARSVPSFCRGRIPQFLPALRAGWVGGDEWRAPFERYAADIIAIAAAKRGPAGAQVSRPAGLTLRLEGTKLVNLRRCGDFPTFEPARVLGRWSRLLPVPKRLSWRRVPVGERFVRHLGITSRSCCGFFWPYGVKPGSRHDANSGFKLVERSVLLV
jgi:hypothetical protein